MDEPELTPDEAMRALAKLFSELPPAPKRLYRRYILEYEDGKPVFRNEEMRSEPVLQRDEFDFLIDQIIDELYEPDPERDGDDIVSQKLAKLFPGGSKHTAKKGGETSRANHADMVPPYRPTGTSSQQN